MRMASSVAKKVAEGMGLGDYLFLPVAPRSGGSVLASLGAATALGAGAGVAADIAAGRMGLNDPYEDPRDARRRRFRRALYGAGIGLGASVLTNLATYAGSAEWREGATPKIETPGPWSKDLHGPPSPWPKRHAAAEVPGPWSKDLHGPPEAWRVGRERLLGKASESLSWFKKSPAETGTESLTSGTISKDLVEPGSTITSRRKGASIRVSDNEMKRMVMADPAIPFHTKRVLFSQIDDATRGRGRSAGLETIAHYGGGAVAGYFSAVAAGAGPVQRGVSAVIGAMIGGAVLNNKRSDEWTYTPGFKSYP